MSTAQQKTASCQVHMHPAAYGRLDIAPDFIFEVRRLAHDAGCTYVASKRRTTQPPKRGPFGGGSAA